MNGFSACLSLVLCRPFPLSLLFFSIFKPILFHFPSSSTSSQPFLLFFLFCSSLAPLSSPSSSFLSIPPSFLHPPLFFFFILQLLLSPLFDHPNLPSSTPLFSAAGVMIFLYVITSRGSAGVIKGIIYVPARKNMSDLRSYGRPPPPFAQEAIQ